MLSYTMAQECQLNLALYSIACVIDLFTTVSPNVSRPDVAWVLGSLLVLEFG
ncbi:MAG: hypothetical protein JSV61_16015 [Anaerolineales bacterium]|nr:MAG: hypothetical protein JSV61_16015 [Anaerolineales bacterium]